MLIKELEKVFRNLETVKQQIMDSDTSVERKPPVSIKIRKSKTTSVTGCGGL
jgi:hypothetical protein